MNHVRHISRSNPLPATAEDLLVLQQKAIILNLFLDGFATLAGIFETVVGVFTGGGE